MEKPKVWAIFRPEATMIVKGEYPRQAGEVMRAEVNRKVLADIMREQRMTRKRAGCTAAGSV